MSSMPMVKGWAVLSGGILVLVGLLGFVDNPIVGKAAGALVTANAFHDLVHISSGVIALWIGLGLRGGSQATALILFGLAYAVVLVATLISPDLFGLFAGYPAGPVEHVIHGGLAIASIGIGLMGRPATVAA